VDRLLSLTMAIAYRIRQIYILNILMFLVTTIIPDIKVTEPVLLLSNCCQINVFTILVLLSKFILIASEM